MTILNRFFSFYVPEIYAQQETLTHEILAALNDFFPDIFADAVDLIDANKVTEFIAKDSGRNFFKVQFQFLVEISSIRSVRMSTRRATLIFGCGSSYMFA